MASSMMLRAQSMGLAAKTSRRSLSVKAGAVPENVQDARNWIANWKNKKGKTVSAASWFPGSDRPAHLDGSLPGDFGFDPLLLGAEKDNLKWYVQGELLNGRFAMLAAAGILLPELASNVGISWPGANVAWYDAGKFEYFAPASTLTAIEILLFAWVEIRRYQDFEKPGSANQDPIFTQYSLPSTNTPGYPGFDPFGYSKSPEFETYKVKELKNGRLAMVAMAGFFAQSWTTGTTPLANLSTHLADPWNTTVFSNDLARL